jgi:uncharacterized Tic20 family protein
MDSPSLPPAPIDSSDKTLAVLAHVAPFLGVPFLLPFIIYLVKRDESAYVAAHAKEALNFHLSMLLYVVCTLPLVLVTCGLFAYLAFPLYIAIAGLSFVCAIVAAIRTSEGGFFRYPLTIRFF